MNNLLIGIRSGSPAEVDSMSARGDIGVQLLEDAYNNGATASLKRIGFTTLYKCDGSCSYCFVRPDIDSGKARIGDEILKAEFQQILRQAIPLGLEEIQLSGGEPMLKNDIFEFVEIAKSLGLRVGIFTNGSRLSEATLGQLNSLGLDWIRISLGGSSDEMSRRAGRFADTKEKFKKIVGNIKASVKAGLVTGVFTPVTKNSYGDISNTAKLANDLGASYIIFCNYILQGNRQDEVNRMTVEQQYHAIETLLEAREEQKGVLDVYAYYGFFEYLSPNWKKSDFVVRAPCARERLAVVANGDIRTCMCTTHRLDSFRTDSFDLKKLWKNHPFLVKIRNSTKPEPCLHCKKRDLCRPCVASTLNLNKQICTAPPQCPAVREYNLLKEIMRDSDAVQECLHHNYEGKNRMATGVVL